MFSRFLKRLKVTSTRGSANSDLSSLSAPAAAFTLLGYQLSWSQAAPPAGPPMLALLVSTEPDLPKAFGYKVGWFAVQSEDAALVARVLGLEAVQVANWKSGVKAAFTSDPYAESPLIRVFVTPPLDGWVLVVGASLPYPVQSEGSNAGLAQIARRFDALMLRLASHFDEVQHFASHRVSSFVSWTRRTERTYRSFTYGDGWVYINRGAQTTAERELGLSDLTGMDLGASTEALSNRLAEEQAQTDALQASGMSPKEATQRVGRNAMPNETHVTDLAGRWSIDPTGIADRFQEKSTGLLGVLNLDR